MFEFDKRAQRLLLFAVIAILALGPHAFNMNPLGFRVDWNLPYDISAMHGMWRGTDGFTPWNYANTGTPLFYPTLAPFLLVVSALSYAVPVAGLVERILIVASMLLAQEGMFLLARRYAGQTASAMLAAIAYGTGTFVFTKMSQGVIQEVVAYAVLPFVALAAERACDHETRAARYAYAALSGVCVLIASVQTQYAPLALTVVFAVCFVRKAWAVAAFATLIAILCEAYAILPLTVSIGSSAQQFLQQSPFAEVVAWAPTLEEAVRQAGYVGRFAENSVNLAAGFGLWWVAGMASILFAIWGLTWKRDRRAKAYGALLACSVLFAAAPKLVPGVFEWLLLHVPLLSLFRETYHVESLVAFFESLGIAYFAASLNVRPPSGAVRGALLIIVVLFAFAKVGADRALVGLVIGAAFLMWHLWRSASLALSQRLVTALVVAVVIIGSPFAGPGLASQVQNFSPPPESAQIGAALSDARGGRVAYLPFLLPMHPAGTPFSGVDPMISWSPLPTFGNYVPTRIAKQFASALYSKDDAQAKMLADWLDIRFLDDRSWVEGLFAQNVPVARTGRFGPTAFSHAGASASFRRIGLHRISSGGDMDRLFRVSVAPSAEDRVIGASSLTVVDGTLKGAAEAYRPGSAVAFVDQNDGATLRKLLSAGAGLFVEGGNPLGLQLAFVDAKYRYAPGRYAFALSADQDWGNQNNWNSWWWLNHDYLSPAADVAVVSRANSHTLRFPPVAFNGAATIAVKYYAGHRSGNLAIAIGDRKWHTDALDASTKHGFRWFTATADVKTGDNLTVTNDADSDGVVANAAVIPSDAFAKASADLAAVLKSTRHVGRTPSTLAGHASVHVVPMVDAGYDRYRTGNVAAGSVAILNTGYSPVWQSSGRAVHFTANGYANGWLELSDSSSVEIYPKTLMLLFLGTAISVLTVLSTIAGLLWVRKVATIAPR